MSSPLYRLLPLVVTLSVTGPIVTVGCSPTDVSQNPPVPRPSGKAAAICRTFYDRLPRRVDGQQRITVTPETRYVAAWGDPAIRLRCGVSRPKVLTPGTEEYNPTAEAAEVNGVSWLLERRGDGYRFTTTDRSVFVEVTVPDHYQPEINALTDLAAPVSRAIPRKPL